MPSGSIWRSRDVRLVIGGDVVNGIGDWMLEIALPVHVFLSTGSGLATAGVYVIELVVGVVFGAHGGALVDRWPLRRTLVGTNLAQAVALAPLLLVDEDRLWPVYVVIVLQALLRQVNDPATFALLPRLVDDDLLVRANAVASSGGALARLVGSPLGGIAVATGGIDAVLVADAATFLVVAVAMSRLSERADRIEHRREGSDAPTGSGEAPDGSVRAGLRLVRALPAVAALVGVSALSRVAFAAFPVLFIVFIGDHLGGGGSAVGIVRGAAAFGGMLAAFVVARVADRFAAVDLVVAGFLSFGVVGLCFANAPSITTALWAYVLLFGLSGFPNVTASIGMTSTAQQLCPPEVRGRLSGLMSAAGAVGAGVGSIGAGVLLEVVSARALFDAQALVLASCGVCAWRWIRRPLRAAGSAAAADQRERAAPAP